jgi:hypothetical protein
MKKTTVAWSMLGTLCAMSLVHPACSQATREGISLYGERTGVPGGLDSTLSNSYKGGKVEPILYTDDEIKQIQSTAANLWRIALAKEQAGNMKEACSFYYRLAQYRQRLFGYKDKVAGDAYYRAGKIALKIGDSSTAEKCFKNALGFCAYRNGPGSQEALPLLSDLAAACTAQAHWADAASSYKQVLQLQERAQGAAAAQAIETKVNLAKSYINSGDYASAAPLLKQSVDTMDKGARLNSQKQAELLYSYLSVVKHLNQPDNPDKQAEPGNIQVPYDVRTVGVKVGKDVDSVGTGISKP